MLCAELEHHLVALFHLPRGHSQGTQRIVDMRVGTCLVKQQVRTPLQDLGEGLFQGGFINPKIVRHRFQGETPGTLRPAAGEPGTVDRTLQQIRQPAREFFRAIAPVFIAIQNTDGFLRMFLRHQRQAVEGATGRAWRVNRVMKTLGDVGRDTMIEREPGADQVALPEWPVLRRGFAASKTSPAKKPGVRCRSQMRPHNPARATGGASQYQCCRDQ